jgi:hypothetical protein
MLSIAIMSGIKAVIFLYAMYETIHFVWLNAASIVLMHAEIVKTGSGKANIKAGAMWWLASLWTAFYFLSQIPV